MIFFFTREYERYIDHLGLDVRAINWNYIIDEVMRRSQYELEHQRKTYLKKSLFWISVQPEKYDLYAGKEVEENNNNNKSEYKVRMFQTGEELNHLAIFFVL